MTLGLVRTIDVHRLRLPDDTRDLDVRGIAAHSEHVLLVCDSANGRVKSVSTEAARSASTTEAAGSTSTTGESRFVSTTTKARSVVSTRGEVGAVDVCFEEVDASWRVLNCLLIDTATAGGQLLVVAEGARVGHGGRLVFAGPPDAQGVFKENYVVPLPDAGRVCTRLLFLLSIINPN